MTAQLFEIPKPTLDALIDQTRAAWDRADEKEIDADDWYIRTGKLLITLKFKAKAEGKKWLPILKKLGRKPRRAQILMKGAENPDAFKIHRERNRKGVQKHRAKKSALRNAYFEDSKDEGQTPEERWQYSLANLCGDMLAIQSYWNKHFDGWKQFECPSHIKKLATEAATEFAALALVLTKR